MGYADGQAIPFDLLLTVVERIAAVSDLPLTVDFEAGYADSPAAVAANAAQLQAAGAVGINLEDGMPPEKRIRPAAEQVALIEAIRQEAGLFINARTDLFLQSPGDAHADLIAEALDRAGLYADAGANGFFVPGLVAPDLIGPFCRDCPLPVNIMKSPAAPTIADLTALGVARISFGPFPWREAMAGLAQAYRDQVVDQVAAGG